MPAIWSSSERPLFVRTVWLDGIRHAILSPDDPVVNPRLRQRPQTSKEKSFSITHQQTETKLDRLNSCFMNLHVVVEKNFPDDKISPRAVHRQPSASSCTRICTDKTGDLLEIYMNDIGKLDEVREEEIILPTVFDYNSNIDQSVYLQQDTFSNTMECKQADKTCDAHWNPLSERVLQWLDLSGKAQDYELEAESEGSSKLEYGRRWSAASRRKRFPSRRESSVLAEKERIVVQNYKLQQKNCKLECLMKAIETKLARKRSSKLNDTMMDEARKEENLARVLSGVSKNHVASAEENDSKNEGESRDNILAVWSPPGRLQLHVVMPNLNSEKRASSLESLICG